MDYKKRDEFRKKLHEYFASLKLFLNENGEVTWPRKEQEKKLQNEKSRTKMDVKEPEKIRLENVLKDKPL